MGLTLNPHEFIPRLIKAQKARMVLKYVEYLTMAIEDGFFGEERKKHPESTHEEPMYLLIQAIEKYAGIKINLEEE